MAFNYQFRVIVIGDSTVGKSSLLQSFSEGRLTGICNPTVGVDYCSKKIRLENNKIIKLQLWDTAGQEKFKSITRAYYRNSPGALLVFDLTNRSSFNHIYEWFREIIGGMQCEHPSIVLCGQKSDLINQRQVSSTEADLLSQRLGNCPYIETSAVTGSNVERAFILLAESIYSKMVSGLYLDLESSGKWDGVRMGYDTGLLPASSTSPVLRVSRQCDCQSDVSDTFTCC